MNLVFKTVKKVDQDGKPFLLQKADVTKSRDFWRNWKTCNGQIKRFIQLRREDNKWIVYRLFPVIQGTYGQFKTVYALKDTSGLLSYQISAVRHICRAIIDHNAALDGSDTGTGKTYTALAVARELGLQPAIICKKAGVSGWKRGCMHYRLKPFFIINWEKAKLCGAGFPYLQRAKDEFSGKYRYRWKMPNGKLLIFDEAHVANNYGTQNYGMYVSSKGLSSISLSATIADRPERLQAVMHVLGAMEKGEFRLFLDGIGHFRNKYDQYESFSNQGDMVQLNKILYPAYGYRITYNDPDVKRLFPQGVYRTQVVNIGTKNGQKQNKLYNLMVQQAQKDTEMGEQANKLVAELRYRQASELLKADVLCELATDYMDQGMSVCIFVNYLDTLKYISAKMKTSSLLFGNQESKGLKRENVLDDFQNNKKRIIVAMVGCGGQSLDLHDLSGNHPRISLICPTYEPITLRQVLGRTYRAGAKSTPVMNLVYAADTIEEKVAETVNAKLDNIAAINDGDLMEPDLFNMGVKQ